MRAFAFAHHAPDEIIIKLRQKYNVERKDIAIVGDEDKISRKSKQRHFVFLSVVAFHHNLQRLAELDAQSYVFDDPISLTQYNLTPADFKMEDYFHVDGFSLVPLIRLDRCPDVEIERQQFNVLDHAKKIAKQQKTFLNQFMTFIYSMPSETHQKPIKELVCKWMASKESIGHYCKRIEKLRQTVQLNDKQVKRLTEILSSETTNLYRKALQMPGDEDDVAKELKISAYELRYIRAINKGEKDKKK